MKFVPIAECTDRAANFKGLEVASRYNCVKGTPMDVAEP